MPEMRGVPTWTTSRGRPQVSFPELKYQVWVVLRRESGLLSIKGSKLREEQTDRTLEPVLLHPDASQHKLKILLRIFVSFPVIQIPLRFKHVEGIT